MKIEIDPMVALRQRAVARVVDAFNREAASSLHDDLLALAISDARHAGHPAHAREGRRQKLLADIQSASDPDAVESILARAGAAMPKD